jgi:D-alanine--poly(phosphoribitol) ligase subunit 1
LGRRTRYAAMVVNRKQEVQADDGDGILERVLRHANERPSSPALKDDAESLDYAELSDRVSALASGLAALGVAPEDRVALLLPNSAAFLLVALACLWTGAVFVPLSMEDPAERVHRLVDNCHPKLLVVPVPHHSPPLSLPAELQDRAVDVETVLGSAQSVPAMARGADRDAYMIYTSGTTGEPKGVRVPERALTSAAVAIADKMGLGPATRSLCVSSFHFDGSYGTVFPTLVAGGSLVIPNRVELLFLRRFFRAVLEEHVTHTGFSPSYLRLLLSSPQFSKLTASALKTLGLGGEECDAGDVARVWEILPDLRVFNRYGPTETTIEATTYEISSEDIASGRVPIGEPHPGLSFYLVGEGGELLGSPHETGELYIGGDQLMRGYWADEELTAQVMRQDVVPGETVYKTGDLVWRDEAGRYFYAGRTDDVVKRSGVRISLNEIARALRGIDNVSAAACLLTDQDGRPAITAYVEAPAEITSQALFEAVSARLPTSMLPDEIFVLPSLPLTSSGKVDRDRLLARMSQDRSARD